MLYNKRRRASRRVHKDVVDFIDRVGIEVVDLEGESWRSLEFSNCWADSFGRGLGLNERLGKEHLEEERQSLLRFALSKAFHK